MSQDHLLSDPDLETFIVNREHVLTSTLQNVVKPPRAYAAGFKKRFLPAIVRAVAIKEAAESGRYPLPELPQWVQILAEPNDIRNRAFSCAKEPKLYRCLGLILSGDDAQSKSSLWGIEQVRELGKILSNAESFAIKEGRDTVADSQLLKQPRSWMDDMNQIVWDIVERASDNRRMARSLEPEMRNLNLTARWRTARVASRLDRGTSSLLKDSLSPATIIQYHRCPGPEALTFSQTSQSSKPLCRRRSRYTRVAS